MYFYLAMVGFEPSPTLTAAPSNTETTVIPSRPLRSLLAHLIRRLIGELIVHQWSGVRRRPSVFHNAQTSSSQKPLG